MKVLRWSKGIADYRLDKHCAAEDNNRSLYSPVFLPNAVTPQKDTVKKETAKKDAVGGYKDRFWYPRFSDGMTLSAWRKLLAAGKCRIAPIRWGMAVIITALAICCNSPAAQLQRFCYGKRIRETELTEPPVFIIGHWRSGTTLLHEYLIRDEQFAFADTFACFAPAHFIVSRYTLRPLAALLMPKKRPIDNMEAGFDRPQEDEFALMSLGLPSPYRNIIFPNNGLNIDTDYLTLRNVSPQERKNWLDTLEQFLKSLTFLSGGKQIILKSPPHTGRIKTLLERFPSAKFVHIDRHPYSLFPSTVNLWKRLAKDEGVQRPKHVFDDYVFDSLNAMYETFDEDVKLLKAEQFCRISYDELTAAPVETLEKIYGELQLGNFGSVRPTMTDYAASQKTYKKNTFSMDDTLRQIIAERWQHYFKRFHYNG
ncbi:MAG: sulfotransferase [Planctomycetaceae bacterium]|nr:sulfotransferase [Planctomycetaceae bacterium]